MSQINEIFSLPVGLKEEITIDGIKLFSSDSLKENFILAFNKSSKGKMVAEDISRMVKDKFIIPCYLSHNLWSFFKSKVFGSEYKDLLAFYHIDSKKVIILIDNNSTVFGTSSNNELASTTMHECMHLIAGRAFPKFLSVMRDTLEIYYTNFFRNFLSLKNISPDATENYISFIKQFDLAGPAAITSKINLYIQVITNNFQDSKLLPKDYNERIVKLAVAVKIAAANVPTFLQKAKNFSMVITSLNQSYFDSFGDRNIYTTPFQELFSISEVACVLTEMQPNNPSIRKLFKLL